MPRITRQAPKGEQSLQAFRVEVNAGPVIFDAAVDALIF
jgi:hypothetical protein